MHFEITYPIGTMDLDCFDCCKASALLGFLQDAAGLAAGEFGATNAEMVRKYNCCWMVARTGFTLDRPLLWGDRLTVKTWHRGGDKALMLRDFDLLADGRAVGRALSVWVLVDLAQRTILRPSRFPEFAGTDGGELIRDSKLPRLKPPAGLVPAGTRTPQYSDTDSNGHVNNTRYADFLCDALELHTAPAGTFIRELHLSYLKECRAGQPLTLLRGREGDRAFVLGRDSGGEDRFHGFLVAGKTSP